jgi:hypothetical protein
MCSREQLHEKADEFGDLAIASDHRPRDSLARDAIDAWESEGGSSLGGSDAACAALADIAKWRANNIAGCHPSHPDKDTLKNDAAQACALVGEEDQILRCLGAAVIMRWNTIPTKLQRELFDNASSVGELLQSGALKGQIARFLHKHKDDAS